ncbi:MAG: hypothetical protein J6M92_16520, partial [Oribacterium sp.]|nr:hypothetical protein [Oribacterium sp.]
SDHELNGIGDVEHPAGYTDYKNRCIVIYAPLCEHAIFHEFGHYFSYIYECNFENIRAEMDSLYTEESRNFVSRILKITRLQHKRCFILVCRRRF